MPLADVRQISFSFSNHYYALAASYSLNSVFLLNFPFPSYQPQIVAQISFPYPVLSAVFVHEIDSLNYHALVLTEQSSLYTLTVDLTAGAAQPLAIIA